MYYRGMSMQILFRKIVALSLLRRISFLFAVIWLALGLPSQAAAQYRVSGVVEFSYRDYQTKTGDLVASQEQYWSQLYRVNLDGPFLDPRFMRFSGGVGYSLLTYKDNPDRDTLDYFLNATFFPGMKISWNLFGSKSTQTIDSTSSIAGYDVTTTSYGATLFYRPVNGGNSRNNRYNNRNNNRNAIGGWLPSLDISRIHTESETQSLLTPASETRDETRVNLFKRINSNFDLNLEGRLEEYENLATGSSYETRTANLRSDIRVSTDGTLTLTGRLSDRDTKNITGFLNSSDLTWSAGALLDFKERDGHRQFYRYDYMDQKVESTTATYIATHTAQARVINKVREEIQLQGGIDYSGSEYLRESTGPSDPGEDSTLQEGGGTAGVLYREKFAPAFFIPVVFDAGYDISVGISDFATETAGADAGSGWYYGNAISLSLGSDSLEKEQMNIGYSYSNKRDHSPVNNDLWRHTLRASFSSQRISNTMLRGSTSYTSQEDTSEGGSLVAIQQPGTNQQRRTFTYDVSAEHRLSPAVSLSAGANRGDSKTTLYTLSNLTLPSITISEDEVIYGSVFFNYPITRMLLYRANVREEVRSSTSGDTRSHQINMNLDYRIRSIFMGLEYRWRQDIPDVGVKTEQQYFFAKLSRPF